MTYIEQLNEDCKQKLQCPSCRGTLSLDEESHLICMSCGLSFDFDKSAKFCSLLLKFKNVVKTDIRQFWGDLYKQLYSKNDSVLNTDLLNAQLIDLEDLFYKRGHLATSEMSLPKLKGKNVLEIGSGGGGHSCLFQSHGAHMTSVDITIERVMSTALKLGMLEKNTGMVYQADAENLPFHENSFDVVYSNGVLHHSSSTRKCVDEVFRVLRPGGKAIIMLYSRHSASFWLNIFLRGILSGEIFSRSEAEWIGRVTEGKPKFGTTKNPITRVYSNKEVLLLFEKFLDIQLRKSSFQFDNIAIPRMTQFRAKLLDLMGKVPHPGGRLIYGNPVYIETYLEMWLGQFFGFAWNIQATKPSR